MLPAAAFCFHICTLPLIWSCGIEADDAAARTQDCKRPFADRRRAVQRRPNGPRPAVCPAEPVCRAMPERQRQALPSAKPPCGPRCRHIQTAHGRLTGRRIGTRRLPAPILFALAARLSLSGQICTAGCRGGQRCPPICPVSPEMLFCSDTATVAPRAYFFWLVRKSMQKETLDADRIVPQCHRMSP